MKIYEVIYSDGNKRLFETANAVMLMKALINEKDSENIIQVIEREVK